MAGARSCTSELADEEATGDADADGAVSCTNVLADAATAAEATVEGGTLADGEVAS
jgi:hypothetical protein